MKRLYLSVFLMLFISIGFADQAVLLVSLGMPDNALKAYLKQGKEYHIPVVIRGLYTNKDDISANTHLGSFQDTVKRVRILTHDSKIGGISIDPLLFRAFAVKAVPALVIYNNELACIQQSNRTPTPVCAQDDFDIVFGNLPIKKLLSIIASRSTSASRTAWATHELNQYQRTGDHA